MIKHYYIIQFGGRYIRGGEYGIWETCTIKTAKHFDTLASAKVAAKNIMAQWDSVKREYNRADFTIMSRRLVDEELEVIAVE